jgi:hypothetical protein
VPQDIWLQHWEEEELLLNLPAFAEVLWHAKALAEACVPVVVISPQFGLPEKSEPELVRSMHSSLGS